MCIGAISLLSHAKIMPKQLLRVRNVSWSVGKIVIYLNMQNAKKCVYITLKKNKKKPQNPITLLEGHTCSIKLFVCVKKKY